MKNANQPGEGSNSLTPKSLVDLQLVFTTRASQRSTLATAFLFIAVIITGYGFYQITIQLNNAMSTLSAGSTTAHYSAKPAPRSSLELATPTPDESPAQPLANKSDIANLVARLLLLAVVFYLAQIFINLYKYNMMTSDYYKTCNDVLDLSEFLDFKRSKRFTELFKAMTASKLEFVVPEPPSMSALKGATPDKD